MTPLSFFFYVVLFLWSGLVTGPSFMSILSLLLELWQFYLIKDWPGIWKSEIPPCEFCPIFEDRGELGILNLARRSLMKRYWMLQNARVTAFIISELIRKNQNKGGEVKSPLPTRIRVNMTQLLTFRINHFIIF